MPENAAGLGDGGGRIIVGEQHLPDHRVVSFGGRPNRTLRWRAMARPAALRSKRRLRSNSLRTARTPTTIFPVAVLVSMLSMTETSFAPLLSISSMI